MFIFFVPSGGVLSRRLTEIEAGMFSASQTRSVCASDESTRRGLKSDEICLIWLANPPIGRRVTGAKLSILDNVDFASAASMELTFDSANCVPLLLVVIALAVGFACSVLTSGTTVTAGWGAPMANASNRVVVPTKALLLATCTMAARAAASS